MKKPEVARIVDEPLVEIEFCSRDDEGSID